MFGFLKRKKDSEVTKSSPLPAEQKTEDKLVQKAQDEPKHTTEEKDLTSALKKTRTGFFSRVKDIFSFKGTLDEESLQEMEALLISADIGIHTATHLIEEVRKEVQSGREVNQEIFFSIMKERLVELLKQEPLDLKKLLRREDGPTVILVVGVNGVGKTTTIGKVSKILKENKVNVMLCAADTFRAAAVEQLQEWSERVGTALVKGELNAKPATVVFEATNQALNENIDTLIIDTAGRLHNKQNLMSELEGIKNSIRRHMPAAPHQTWLVIDGTTGQNGYLQAKEFNQITPLTGIIVTKLDGTAKGGILIAISRELKIPIYFVGVGEGIDDLKRFVPNEFVEALFEESGTYTVTDNKATANATIRRQKRERRAV